MGSRCWGGWRGGGGCLEWVFPLPRAWWCGFGHHLLDLERLCLPPNELISSWTGGDLGGHPKPGCKGASVSPAVHASLPDIRKISSPSPKLTSAQGSLCLALKRLLKSPRCWELCKWHAHRRSIPPPFSRVAPRAEQVFLGIPCRATMGRVSPAAQPSRDPRKQP